MKTVVHYKFGAFLPVTENWIYSQISNLKTWEPVVYCRGIENAVVYPVRRMRDFDWSKGGAWAFVNRACNKVLGFQPAMAMGLLKDRPALIHAHFGPSGYHMLALKRLLNIPMATTFYGQDLTMLPVRDERWRGRYLKLFKHGDRFFVEGNHMRETLIRLGCPGEKIVVQHIGVESEKIAFQPRKIGQSGEVRVLIAGAFREKKGIPYAVEAFGLVKKKHPGLKLKLTIIGASRGTPSEEEEKKNILAALSRYGLENDAAMPGFQPHDVLWNEMYKAHIFLSPSVTAADGDTEGGAPVSIIEASASGMPVVSTAHCDIPEVVLDGQSGFLVPERDVKALAEKLEALVLDPALWEKFGAAGRKHIEENYDISKQVRRLEALYDSMSTPENT